MRRSDNSSALTRSDIVWTNETIGRLFEIGPEVLTPGTKMPLQRMPDAKDRADLLAYIREVTGALPPDTNDTSQGAQQ